MSDQKSAESPDQFMAMDLLNTFGKAEMEHAAKIILDRCCVHGGWDCAITLEYFASSRGATIGFLWLLHLGWMDFGETSDAFIVGAKFVSRLAALRDVPVDRRHLVCGQT